MLPLASPRQLPESPRNPLHVPLHHPRRALVEGGGRAKAPLHALRNENLRLLALQQLINAEGLSPLIRGYDFKYDDILQIIERSSSLAEFTKTIKERTRFPSLYWYWHTRDVEEPNAIRQTLGLPPFSSDRWLTYERKNAPAHSAGAFAFIELVAVRQLKMATSSRTRKWERVERGA
jgi:hypothetical protein